MRAGGKVHRTRKYLQSFAFELYQSNHASLPHGGMEYIIPPYTPLRKDTLSTIEGYKEEKAPEMVIYLFLGCLHLPCVLYTIPVTSCG